MSKSEIKRLPEVMVIAGPNGSGKSTITKMLRIVGKYINADDIKKAILCSDLEAAEKAEELREQMLSNHADFTFETVLSTERNLKLLKKAKLNGYFIRGIYILTADANINIARVRSRVAIGGHDVPEDKIRSRYAKSLNIIPQLVEICDVLHIYDNTKEPFRIFKKRKDIFFRWENLFWSKIQIENLTGIHSYSND